MPLFNRDPFKNLEKALGKDKLLRQPHDLALYAMDATQERNLPVAVILAESSDDVVEAVKFAATNGLSITPRGAGSGLSGGSVPTGGGIVISFERMKSIEPINTKAMRVIVQPGVVTADLQAEVAKAGLFYPPDPSSHTVSTIGGNVAENAGGLRCFKYGVTSHYVLGLEYVDTTGIVRSTGTFLDSAQEPDQTALLVGSEGTLGIFTRIELKLIPKPEATVTIAAWFGGREDALGVVERIVRSGLTPAVMEFIDQSALKAAASFAEVTLPEGANSLLLLEADGSAAEAEELTGNLLKLLSGKAVGVERADLEADRERLWKLRRSISPSLIRLATGKIHEDIAVPRGRIGDLARAVEEIGEANGTQVAMYGHAGDGNLHIVLLYEAAEIDQNKRASESAEQIYKAAISLGGTITGEHGVGSTKRKYLEWQIGATPLAIQKRIKKHYDSQSILNPGKVLPD